MKKANKVKKANKRFERKDLVKLIVDSGKMAELDSLCLAGRTIDEYLDEYSYKGLGLWVGILDDLRIPVPTALLKRLRAYEKATEEF